jgi:hypothetical protein
MEKSKLAKAIVAYCFRNTSIEDIHAGIAPVSNTGDFSDEYPSGLYCSMCFTDICRIGQRREPVSGRGL